MSGATVAAVGLLTGWGPGVDALPEDAARAAGGRRVIPIPRPAAVNARFRRASRECVAAVMATEAALDAAGLDRAKVRGSRTGVVYVTSAAYASANRAFIEQAPGTFFPYTAPNAVPAEVTIELEISGPYVILIGGPATTLDGLWHAAGLLGAGACDRVLVLAVETFEECADLYDRARWLLERPLVEAAACAVLVPAGSRALHYEVVSDAAPLDRRARLRAGETLACEPLIALALGSDASAPAVRVTGAWRDRRVALDWPDDRRVGT
jgi:hypothetical protein